MHQYSYSLTAAAGLWDDDCPGSRPGTVPKLRVLLYCESGLSAVLGVSIDSLFFEDTG